MDYTAVRSAVKALPRDEQIRLYEELGDDLSEVDELDEETKRILDARIADMEANPNDVVPWEQIYAEIRAELRK